MSTSVTFETATIADVLKKAETCAPSARGDSHVFGTAAGVVMEVWPGQSDKVQVRSTNLEVFYTEQVDYVESSGPSVQWRLPSKVISGIVAALPIGTGRTVTFTQDGRWLSLASGRTAGRVMLIPMGDYPAWELYTEERSSVVRSFGQSLAQIEWACAAKGEPLTGVYFDGSVMMATDRYRAATVPCEIPILDGTPVTAPAKLLTPVLRHAGDVRVGVVGSFLTISPDEHTQIRCVVYGKNIPSPSAFTNISYDSSVLVHRDQVVEMVTRMLNVAKGSDKEPKITMLVGGEQLTLRIDGASPGEWVQDSIDLEGQADHMPVILRFLPKNITDAIGRAPDEKVALHYNAHGGKNTVVHVDGGADYRTWFVQVGKGEGES